MLDLTKFIVCIADLSMVTFSGTAHIQMISFLPGTGKHFTGKPLCSSDDSVMQLLHILHFCVISSVFYKPPEEINPEESILENDGPGSGVPSSFPMIRIVPVQKRTNMTGEETEKLFLQDMT
jgi:hypothetical protein